MPPPRENSKDEVMEQLQALGYIDPGAGSSMFQLTLVGFLKASKATKYFFRKLFHSGRSGEFEEREQ